MLQILSKRISAYTSQMLHCKHSLHAMMGVSTGGIYWDSTRYCTVALDWEKHQHISPLPQQSEMKWSAIKITKFTCLWAPKYSANMTTQPSQTEYSKLNQPIQLIRNLPLSLKHTACTTWLIKVPLLPYVHVLCQKETHL